MEVEDSTVRVKMLQFTSAPAAGEKQLPVKH